LDEFKVSLLSDNPLLKLRFKLLEPVLVFGKLAGFRRRFSPSSFNSYPLLLIISSAGGGRMSSRER
jgi:hypothetical protein